MTKNNKILSFDEHVKKYKLDEEEAELLRSFEAGEWKSTSDIEKIREEMRKNVEYTWKLRKKNKNANFRIQQKDLDELKKRAAQKGLKYQTLISSLIHQYLTGQIQVKL